MAILFEPWKQFQHPIVRQLAFCIASPNILSSIPSALSITHHFEFHTNIFWQTQFENYFPRLQQLDKNPQPLLDFIAQLKSTRLGLRFEYLLWFWLKDSTYHPFRLLGHSIQIIHAKQTLGELDFLLFNEESQQIEHWEVALKFYLAENNFNLNHWYGLNRTDTLHRKLTHFTQKQFQFDAVHQHDIQKRFAILKGQLYLPQSFVQLANDIHSKNLKIPNWINQSRNIGQWGYHIPQQAHYRLQRQEWICPNANITSSAAQWWTNGLYKCLKKDQYFMFRQSIFNCLNVEQL